MDKSTKKQQLSSFQDYLDKFRQYLNKNTNYVRLFLVLMFVLLIYGGLHWSGNVIEKSGADYYAEILGDFIRTPDEKIKIDDGRTNVLLLGKGGEGHEGPDLTDTVIFASIEHETNDITFISLPRDIWIEEYRAKLNSIYYWGERLEDKNGIGFVKEVVSSKLNQPVHYAVVVDFVAFKQVIDIIGGIEIDVDNSFVDEKYPIPGRENDLCDGDLEYLCRYETISFQEGTQTMDGERALKFVRSRNAESDQGTDFARAARQQKVIAAVKDKVISSEVLLSRDKVNQLISTGQEHIDTDMSMSAAAILARRGLEARGQIDSNVLPEELLENPEPTQEYDNLYVFIPLNGDWKNIQQWVNDLLSI